MTDEPKQESLGLIGLLWALSMAGIFIGIAFLLLAK